MCGGGSGSRLGCRKFWHQEMGGGLGEGFGAVVLPRLHLNTCIAAARAGDRGAGVGIARQSGAKVIDSKGDGFGQGREGFGIGVDAAGFHVLPKGCPSKGDDGCHFEERRCGPAVQGGDAGIADEGGVEWQDCCQLIPAAVETGTQEGDVGHTGDEAGKGCFAAGFDNLYGFGRRAAHTAASGL